MIVSCLQSPSWGYIVGVNKDNKMSKSAEFTGCVEWSKRMWIYHILLYLLFFKQTKANAFFLPENIWFELFVSLRRAWKSVPLEVLYLYELQSHARDACYSSSKKHDLVWKEQRFIIEYLVSHWSIAITLSVLRSLSLSIGSEMMRLALPLP